METLISVSLIQQMLAPGLMISACGLLLLGINNKQVAAQGRIRNLEEEKRNLIRTEKKEPLDEAQVDRLQSLDYQLLTYARRVVYFRNSVFFYTIAVALFVFASLAIGFQQLGDIDIFSSVALISFMVGMICTLGGALFAAVEVWLAYRVITREIHPTRHARP